MNIKLSLEDSDYAAMTLANYILGGSGGSRLFKRIRDKEGLSYGVSSSVGVPNKDNGAAFRLSSICNPANAPKVEASFRDELARTVKDGFTAEEVETAKKSWKETRLVQRSTDQNLLAVLLNRERFDRTLKFDEALEDAVAALTPQQVSDAFRKYVDPSAISYIKAGDFKKAGVLQ
jgi:zinc protease